MHVLALAAAEVEEYVPALQLVRTVSPVDVQYVPPGQGLHVDDSLAPNVWE